MKRDVFIIFTLVIFTLACSQPKSRGSKSYDCIKSNIPTAVRIFNDIDSLLHLRQPMIQSNNELYLKSYYSLHKMELKINPLKIWNRKSDPMEFFSPANYTNIKNCLLENKSELDSKKFALYNKVLDVPLQEEINPQETEEYVKSLIGNSNSELDKFFFFYIMWYTINVNFHK